MEKFTTDLLSMPFTAGLVILLTAVVMYIFPPKKINYLYGYRTSESMKSQAAWDFAQRYSVFQMIKSAVFMIIISFTGLLFPKAMETESIIGICILLSMVVYLFISTEKAIKKQFPNL